MIVALDVHYDDAGCTATAAAVALEGWTAAMAAGEFTAVVGAMEPYQPAEFYRRELPRLLAVLQKIKEPIDVAVIDGYVALGDKRPGLGHRLWDATGRQFAVVGVAKSSFPTADAVEVFRGRSRTPLFVTSVGIDLGKAANAIQQMHGEFRIPTLLKRADALARHGHGHP